jgi:hypothetical protein
LETAHGQQNDSIKQSGSNQLSMNQTLEGHNGIFPLIQEI